MRRAVGLAMLVASCTGADRLTAEPDPDAARCAPAADAAPECPAPPEAGMVYVFADAAPLVCAPCAPCSEILDAGVPGVRWSDGGSCVFYSHWSPELLDWICEDDLQHDAGQRCELLGFDWDSEFLGVDHSLPLCSGP